jgi:Arc/MetJ family transcription regulator
MLVGPASYAPFMTRITVEVNDELLEAAREALGTDSHVATIDAALRSVVQGTNRRHRHILDREFDLGRC